MTHPRPTFLFELTGYILPSESVEPSGSFIVKGTMSRRIPTPDFASLYELDALSSMPQLVSVKRWFVVSINEWKQALKIRLHTHYISVANWQRLLDVFRRLEPMSTDHTRRLQGTTRDAPELPIRFFGSSTVLKTGVLEWSCRFPGSWITTGRQWPYRISTCVVWSWWTCRPILFKLPAA